jgi:hypothetical protein
MTKKEILKGNLLISEFMGDHIMKETDGVAIISKTSNGMWFSGTKRLKNEQKYCYHSSWNWLMTVLEKIGNLKSLEKDGEWYDFVIQNSQTSKDDYSRDDFDYDNNSAPKIFNNEYTTYIGRIGEFSTNLGKISSARTESLVESTWLCVIDFIKWNNEKTK